VPEKKLAGNTIAYVDQALFLSMRANGTEHAIQCTWIYDRPVDMDGLSRLNDNLAHGLLGRRIERSVLPFGRHHWVAAHTSPAIDVAATPGTPADLPGWLDTRAEIPTDAEFGPSWHIGVLPMGDDGTAVTLVASHSVIDAVGLCLALADATQGVRHDYGYPPQRARLRSRALVEDARQTARDIPKVAKGLASAAKVAVRTARESSQSDAPPPASHAKTRDGKLAVVTTATAHIELADWDARAAVLGGSSNSLFAGFCAQLAQKVGRVGTGTGLVSLTYPVNDRTDGDTRANALRAVDFTVDPANVTEDLRGVREKTKEALTHGLGIFEELEAGFALTPLIPKAAIRNAPAGAVWFASLPVGCSNLGEIDPAVTKADGTEAGLVSVRLLKQNLATSNHDVRYGELYLMSGRVCGKVFVTVRYNRPGADASKDELRDLIAQTLTDFQLTGIIE
jgi:diacylglycerol O-acyltransferase / wax synthase